MSEILGWVSAALAALAFGPWPSAALLPGGCLRWMSEWVALSRLSGGCPLHEWVSAALC